jgi:antitoxin (DNA-binding transcriptional repressor) of toxin-antitoxin stability system
MQSVAVFEANNRFSELTAAVEHGEEISITPSRGACCAFSGQG